MFLTIVRSGEYTQWCLQVFTGLEVLRIGISIAMASVDTKISSKGGLRVRENKNYLRRKKHSGRNWEGIGNKLCME